MKRLVMLIMLVLVVLFSSLSVFAVEITDEMLQEGIGSYSAQVQANDEQMQELSQQMIALKTANIRLKGAIASLQEVQDVLNIELITPITKEVLSDKVEQEGEGAEGGSEITPSNTKE